MANGSYFKINRKYSSRQITRRNFSGRSTKSKIQPSFACLQNQGNSLLSGFQQPVLYFVIITKQNN